MHPALLTLLQTTDGTAPSWSSFPLLDKIGAVILVLFAVLGFWRGLWWQVIRLAGFIGAFAAARLLSPQVEPWLTSAFNITDERFSQGLAWVGLFLLGLLAAVLLGRIGNKLLDSLKLGLANRFAGLVAGAATGLAIHAALLAVLSLFAPPTWLNDQLEGSVSAEVLAQLADRWPVIVDKKQGQWIGNELLQKPGAVKLPQGTFGLPEGTFKIDAGPAVK